MTLINKQVVLASRPNGIPELNNFRIQDVPVPELKDGEVLLKTLYFSLDPYMRPRMNETKGSYIPCFPLHTPLDGGAVCVVEQSRCDDLKVGDKVLSATGWQTYAVLPGKLGETISMNNVLIKLSNEVKPSLYLGVLGMPGLTAHYGLLSIGQPKPGETVVISAATGAVGAVVGQLAKAKGCRVVGIAGGADKCQYAVKELGYDACIDYKAKTFVSELKKACPNRIDVYFENVGGRVFKTILPMLNNFARVPVCGAITYYNDGSTLQEPGFKLTTIFAKIMAFIRLFLHLDYTPLILSSMIGKRLKMQGLIVTDHADHYQTFLNEMIPLIQDNKMKSKEDIVTGIENAPAAFIKLLKGGNFGKLIIQI